MSMRHLYSDNETLHGVACGVNDIIAKALVVLWDFKGLQASKTQSARTPNFLPLPPPFNRIPDAAPPHSATSPRNGSRADGRSLRLAALWGRRRVHDGSDPVKDRILNLSQIQFIRKECRHFDAARPHDPAKPQVEGPGSIDASHCADCAAPQKEAP
jgi:hypothetical protein